MTKRSASGTKAHGIDRWYDDACGTAHALELIGERWALLIVRELMYGPRRFGELRASLPGISANALTQRLLGLESSGIARRRQLPTPANAQVYELTTWGYELGPAIRSLGRWAAASPAHDPSLPLSAVSIMMSQQTMVDAAKLRKLPPFVAGFRLSGEPFTARLVGDELIVTREDPSGASFVLSTTPEMLGALLYDEGSSIADLEASGSLTVGGDRALAKRYGGSFRLPPKAAPAAE